MELVALVLAAFLQLATLSLDQLRETVQAIATAVTDQYEGVTPASGPTAERLESSGSR